MISPTDLDINEDIEHGYLPGIPRKCQCGTWARYDKPEGKKRGECFSSVCPACHRPIEIVIGMKGGRQ